MTDLFETRIVKPMLIGAEGEAFDSDDHIFELKLDGIRAILFTDGKSSVFHNKRSLIVSPIYPELSNTHKHVKGRCILDGEIFVMNGDAPDFSEVQRRALMTNPVKIGMAAAKMPVSFVAFDILYMNGKDLTGLPLMERKAILQKTVTDSDRISVSRVVEREGIAFYQLAAQRSLEGIVAKLKSSKYYLDKRTTEWIKIKSYLDDDFVVCGYIEKARGVASIVLGQYEGAKLVYKGHVTLGLSGEAFARIKRQKPAVKPPFASEPKGNENAVWLAPKLVCTVKFMERTRGGGMRQPVFKGLRDDKEPRECVVK